MNTILVIDDDESYRSLMCDALESEGYKVFVAAGGIQAINILKETTPDVVITDIIMKKFLFWQSPVLLQKGRRF